MLTTFLDRQLLKFFSSVPTFHGRAELTRTYAGYVHISREQINQVVRPQTRKCSNIFNEALSDCWKLGSVNCCDHADVASCWFSPYVRNGTSQLATDEHVFDLLNVYTCLIRRENRSQSEGG